MKPGDYLTRKDVPRSGVIYCAAAAVVLGVGLDSIDVLTFGGMRSLVERQTFERLWAVSPRPKVTRKIPLDPGQAPAKLILRASGEPEVVELWPWNDTAEALANLARCGLSMGKLLRARQVGSPATQLMVFAVEGAFREPLGFVDFPPFAAVDPWKRW